MYDMADVPTYEEVTPYRRPNGAKHRLVVLVGESSRTSILKRCTTKKLCCDCICRASVDIKL